MLEFAKLIHEAIGIESPRVFIVVCALFGMISFSALGWLIDKGYRAKLKEEASITRSEPPTSRSPAKTEEKHAPSPSGCGPKMPLPDIRNPGFMPLRCRSLHTPQRKTAFDSPRLLGLGFLLGEMNIA